MRRTHLAATLLCVVATPFLLTACGGDDLSERLVERAAEGAGGDVDVDLDGDGSMTITSSEGTFSTGTDLPADFPDDIPLVEGTVNAAVSSSDTPDANAGWVVSMVYDGAPDEALAQAVDLLTGAGFTLDEEASASGAGLLGAQSLDRDAYTVLVTTLGEDTTGTMLQYYIELRAS